MGTQYRSVIFYRGEDQREVAEKLIDELEGQEVWDAPIVTQVEPFEAFYGAEDYHLNYYENNRGQPYCRLVIDPKIDKMRRSFEDKLKK